MIYDVTDVVIATPTLTKGARRAFSGLRRATWSKPPVCEAGSGLLQVVRFAREEVHGVRPVGRLQIRLAQLADPVIRLRRNLALLGGEALLVPDDVAQLAQHHVAGLAALLAQVVVRRVVGEGVEAGEQVQLAELDTEIDLLELKAQVAG